MAFDISNPYRLAVQKYAHQILGDKYPRYGELILRLSNVVVTPNDLTDFGQMLVEIYQTGYLKAVEDYRKAVESHGFKVDIKPENKP